MSKTKNLLQEMLDQNKLTCSFAFDKVTQENSTWRLNPKTASIGFIYRHVGETMNLFGHFFGVPSSIPNTTMGRNDEGTIYEVSESKSFMLKGFDMLENLIHTYPESEWNQVIETPFFGTVTKTRLFSHILFHNAHHAGQIALTLSRGA